eukprot:g13071.t1
MEEYEVRIGSLFRDHYLRNNKRGGLKNLRCFPECLPIGHNPKGFCGHSVTATVCSNDYLPANSLLLARFSTRDDPLPEPSSLSLVVGSSYSVSRIKSRIRDKEDPLKEFVISEKVLEENLSDSGRVKTTYVFAPTSWHYGWRSSKHRKHQMHSLRIYLFITLKSKQLTLMAQTKSTDFAISSSKRAKGGQEPTQQHLSASKFRAAGPTKKRRGEGDHKAKRSAPVVPKKRRKTKAKAVSTDSGNDLDLQGMGRVFEDSDTDSNVMSSSRALLDTFLGWSPEMSEIDSWIPLSQRVDKSTARRQTLQRLLLAVSKIGGEDDDNQGCRSNNEGNGGQKSEEFLQGLLKGEFLDLSPFGTNVDVDDILNFASENDINDISILKALATYMVDSNEMTLQISKFLNENKHDIEKLNNMEKLYDDMLELCEKLIDDFLVRHGSSISNVLEIVHAKKRITRDFESGAAEGRKLCKEDLGLWVLSAVASPTSPETIDAGNSIGNGLANNMFKHNGLYDWKSVVEGDRESYFLKCGVPWLARKLIKYMFTQFRVKFFFHEESKTLAVDLQVRSRLGMNGYLTFVGDGKIHPWPIQGGALFGLLESPNFGGEYTCKIDPKTKTAQVRHILRSKDETTITGYFDNADNLHILLKYFKYVGSEEAKSGGTKLVEDQSARSHELFSISAQK